MASGILYFNDRDVDTDFSLHVTDLQGWPGGLGTAPRLAPLVTGPEMSGGIADPSTLKRDSVTTATVAGIVQAASAAAARTALDALAATLGEGEIAVRSVYASDRYCLAICTGFEAAAYQPVLVDGNVSVKLTFTVRTGVAYRTNPDGYALTTTKQACPVGTAVSRPVILVHGGGASLTNPTVTITNAAGDTVAAVSFTVSLGASDVLRIDVERGTVSKIASGVVSDAIAAGLWTSTTAPTDLILRPADGWFESSAWPCVAVSSTGGTPVGLISYTRRYL